MASVYAGLHNDNHGMTQLGRIVLDGWLFGLIPETEDGRGWDIGRMQGLMEEVQNEWDKYQQSAQPPATRTAKASR